MKLFPFSKREGSIFVGNAIDHFDTALYSFLVPILAPHYFPATDPIVQLILGYSVLATSLITRPIGSLLFGLIAKHFNPETGLYYSLLGMALASLSLCFLPGFEKIGFLAPLGLIFCRMIRGIFAAGEACIAKLYILEEKTESMALQVTSYYEGFMMLGYILASIAATLIISFFEYTGARFCFGLSGLLALCAYFFRNQYGSTSTFNRQKNEFHKSILLLKRDDINSPTLLKRCDNASPSQLRYDLSSTLRLIWQNKFQIIKIALVSGLSYCTYSVSFIFMNTFVPLITEYSLESMMVWNTKLLIFDFIIVMILGQLLVPFKGTKIMWVASVVLALSFIPCFQALPNANLFYILFVRFWIVFWGVVFLCPLNLWCKKLFLASDQYLLVGLGNALGTTLFGRLTPAFCLYLWHETGLPWLPGGYLSFIAMMVIFAIVIDEKIKQKKEFSLAIP